MRVSQLWRYPVKSLQGEQVEVAELGADGVRGDRQWAIFDVATGFGLTARRAPELLLASARLRGHGDVDITLPDGTVVREDDALSAWLGRPVRLQATVERAGPREYENPEDTETETPGSWRTFTGSDHAFHDGFGVTLLSAATIGAHPLRRFRANIVLDTPGDDDLVGSMLRVGGAQIDIEQGVPRCVMVTRPQPGGIDTDREVLRWIHRERGGRLAVGGTVTQHGPVAVGDEVARPG